MKKIIVFFIYLTMGINILFAQDIESNIKERLRIISINIPQLPKSAPQN